MDTADGTVSTDALMAFGPLESDEMMLPTHAVCGMAAALPCALAVPELGGVVLVAGFLGGVLPDLDMYVGHRKTLHYPVYYSVLAVVFVSIAVLTATPWVVATAFFLVGASLHSLMDVLGGGLELRPWEATSDRAVYDHHRGRWIGPRRWIRYDGAPEDFVLSVALATPLLVVLDGVFESVVLLSLAVAMVYAAVRRSLPAIAEGLVERLLVMRVSHHVLVRVPDRYVDVTIDGHVDTLAEE